MFNMAIQSLSKDTMDTSSQHTIPMQAFCFQLPGIGAPPARAKYSVFEVRGLGAIAALYFLMAEWIQLLLSLRSVPDLLCVWTPCVIDWAHIIDLYYFTSLQNLGLVKQDSPEPGDFLRLLLYNPRVPLSETINSLYYACGSPFSNACFASI